MIAQVISYPVNRILANKTRITAIAEGKMVAINKLRPISVIPNLLGDTTRIIERIPTNAQMPTKKPRLSIGTMTSAFATRNSVIPPKIHATMYAAVQRMIYV